MNKEQHAKQDFDRLINTYPGLFKSAVAVMQEIAEIGSIKQSREEAEKRLASIREELATFDSAMVARKADVERQIADRQRAADEYEAKQKASADRIRNDADSAAREIIQKAETKAREMIAAATVEVAAQEEVARLATGTANEATELLVVRKQEIQRADVQLAQIRVLNEQVQKDIAALKARI